MNTVLEKLLPDSLKYQLIAWSSVYHFNQKKEEVPPLIQKKLDELIQNKNKAILFSGYIKSGNTWLRFLIYNYINLLTNPESETLSYSELNEIQNDQLNAKDENPLKGPKNEIPYLIRTHEHYRKAFSVFEKCIYVYRNPLDTLVSAFHFRKKHGDLDLGFDESSYSKPIDHFVRYNLKLWELHLLSYKNHFNCVMVKYEDLHQQPTKELKRIIEFLGYDFDEKIGQRSVELSSFQSIQKMGRDKNQAYGNGGKNFTGEFARKGIVGGYNSELSKETIRAAKPYFVRYGFDF